MRLDGWEGTWQGNHYNNPSSREYLTITTSLLEQQSKNQKFLDVGTCEGFYVIHVARKGHWGLGVDLNKKFIKKAREQAKRARFRRKGLKRRWANVDVNTYLRILAGIKLLTNLRICMKKLCHQIADQRDSFLRYNGLNRLI